MYQSKGREEINIRNGVGMKASETPNHNKACEAASRKCRRVLQRRHCTPEAVATAWSTGEK